MAKIPRITQKIFAENAGSNEVTAFGTAKNGNDAEYTKDVSKIQTEAFTQGWEPALLTDDAPFMEDMNAVLLAQSQQIAYLFQEGNAEWDNQTTYYKFSIVKKVINEELKLFYSLTDDNIGNDPAQDTSGTNWKELSFGGEAQYAIGDPIIALSSTLEDNEIWLEGGTVSRTTYAELFAIYGTTYGAGDGSTTFVLPDFRNRAIWGANSFPYINQPEKRAFPEMNQYDQALRLLGLLGSSTAAILQTIKGIVKRLQGLENVAKELTQWQEIQAVAESIPQDAKAGELLTVLKQGFSLMKKTGAKQKAVIFTESVETQKMLQNLLSGRYRTLAYNGSADYSVIRQFKEDGEVLISTDNGAKGFNLEEAAFIIHYDLLYNTLKLEQRIDRCHRLGQENDVLSVAFIDKNNFADVRKLELVNKRMLVTDGVFGITDDVLGGFTDDVKAAFPVIAQRLRPRAQIEQAYRQTLSTHEEDNRQTVSAAEDILFTTFTKELADKVKINPKYVNRRGQELNNDLWEITKWFFTRYNEKNDDCRFVIDESNRTITATEYRELPVLFYYWTGSRNRPYRSQKMYGMAKDFKPKAGQITLSSIIGRGILHELECANEGVLTIPTVQEPCQIALYTVTLVSGSSRTEHAVLCGLTDSGKALDDAACRSIFDLPVESSTEDERRSPHWLKGTSRPHPLDRLVPSDKMMAEQLERLSPAQAEEMERMKQQVSADKAALSRELNTLDSQVQQAQAELEAVTGDRLKRLAAQKKINQLRQEYMKHQESQFFDAMRLDMELEEKMKSFADKEKLTARVQREFVVVIDKNAKENN